MKTISFFYDFISPAAYLANHKLKGICRREGATVEFRPIFLGPLLELAQNKGPALVPAKKTWLLKDLARHARDLGVPFAVSEAFPFSTVHALRGALAAAEINQIERYTDALFHAIWGEGKNLSKLEALVQTIEEAGLDAGALLTRGGEQDIKDRLGSETEAAAKAGIFGAPSFILDGELYFGQDRMNFLEADLRQVRTA